MADAKPQDASIPVPPEGAKPTLPSGKNLAAVRMMTRTLVGHKRSSERVVTVTKPSQKPGANDSGRGSQRGVGR